VTATSTITDGHWSATIAPGTVWTSSLPPSGRRTPRLGPSRRSWNICRIASATGSAAPERHVDISRTQHDALDLQSHEIAVAELQRRGRLAWDNLPIDVPNLMPNRGDYQLLDVWSRDAGDAACFVLAVLQHGLRDIVAVAHALLVGVARAHQVAAIIEEKAGEEGRRARLPHLASDRPILELRLHGLEQLLIDDRLLFAGMDFAPIDDFADVEAVLEEVGQRPHHEAGRIDRAAVTADTGPWPHTTSMKIFDQQSDRAECKVAAEDGSDMVSLFLDDDELLGNAPVTERHGSADPEALSFGGGDLVADTLTDHFSFELGE